MLQLIKNEHRKIMRQKITLIALGLIVVFQMTMVLVMKRVISNLGGQDTVANYFAYSTNVVLILQVLAVVIGATLISTEFQKRTILFLLIRPKTRLHIFLSKYITLVLTVTYLFLYYYVLSFLFGLIFFGTEFDAGTERLFLLTFAVIGSQWVEVIMMASFALMCSSLFRNSMIALVTSFFVLYAAKSIVPIMSLLEIQWGKILLFANTDFWQYSFQGPPPFNGMSPMLSLLIVGAHFVFFVGTAWFLFWKRDVNV
ncbi:ABC transporter permease [Bacillus sp. FJAT-53060]|uniref:ABC transporter permease n=1 Tax=Bacillus TaxID=1386 RepID=UPI001CF96158|nr:ABC transporter permease [Bacillus stratosphericus]